MAEKIEILASYFHEIGLKGVLYNEYSHYAS